MIRTSKAAQVEAAVRMYFCYAQAHGGEMPCIKAHMYDVARRLIGFQYDPTTSTWRLPVDADNYLQANGFDPKTLCVVDYEKFDAFLDRQLKEAAKAKKAHIKRKDAKQTIPAAATFDHEGDWSDVIEPKSCGPLKGFAADAFPAVGKHLLIPPDKLDTDFPPA